MTAEVLSERVFDKRREQTLGHLVNFMLPARLSIYKLTTCLSLSEKWVLLQLFTDLWLFSKSFVNRELLTLKVSHCSM